MSGISQGEFSMASIIDDLSRKEALEAPARLLAASRKAVAITGAGISVESGIPDFRSPGGVWERFDPFEYAYIDTFLTNPSKSWLLFREIGRILIGKEPNPAHRALAELENRGILHTLITQNVDGLHQKAGSRSVIEVHGDHFHLECIQCGSSLPVQDEHITGTAVPRCARCGFPLKPAVVLFGEAIRGVGGIEVALEGCDVLLVVGTSAQVHPVASFPWTVLRQGGAVIEFNLEETPLTEACSRYLVKGPASATLAAFIGAL
jgi:NAD-dependent deacetylase